MTPGQSMPCPCNPPALLATTQSDGKSSWMYFKPVLGAPISPTSVGGRLKVTMAIPGLCQHKGTEKAKGKSCSNEAQGDFKRAQKPGRQ